MVFKTHRIDGNTADVCDAPDIETDKGGDDERAHQNRLCRRMYAQALDECFHGKVLFGFA